MIKPGCKRKKETEAIAMSTKRGALPRILWTVQSRSLPSQSKFATFPHFIFDAAPTGLPPVPCMLQSAAIAVRGSANNLSNRALSRENEELLMVRLLPQSCHHISELGLGDTVPGKQLASLRSQAESTPEGALGQQWRSDFAEKVPQVLHEVSGLARAQPPGFRPNPE